jgi:hypothetical protein
MNSDDDLVYPLAPVSKYRSFNIDQSNLNVTMKKLDGK